MSTNDTKQATRQELARAARRNYEENVQEAGNQAVWTSSIGHAIDAWEREPELLRQLAEAYDAVVRYGVHKASCSNPCDCGFRAAYRIALDAATPPQKVPTENVGKAEGARLLPTWTPQDAIAAGFLYKLRYDNNPNIVVRLIPRITMTPEAAGDYCLLVEWKDGPTLVITAGGQAEEGEEEV